MRLTVAFPQHEHIDSVGGSKSISSIFQGLMTPLSGSMKQIGAVPDADTDLAEAGTAPSDDTDRLKERSAGKTHVRQAHP